MCFDLERMKEALASETFMVPAGMDREQTRNFIISMGKTDMPTIFKDDLVTVTRFGENVNTYKAYNKAEERVGKITFQNGFVSEEGNANGLTNEAVIAIVRDRLICQNKGNFKSPHNDKAIECLTAALAALEARVADRKERGVSNTHKK